MALKQCDEWDELHENLKHQSINISFRFILLFQLGVTTTKMTRTKKEISQTFSVSERPFKKKIISGKNKYEESENEKE